MNLYIAGKCRVLATRLRSFNGIYAAMSVALSLQLSGCGTTKTFSTQELEPPAFMQAVLNVAEHGDLSDSAYTAEALHIVFTTEGMKNKITMDGIKVARQTYSVLFQSNNYSRNSFSYSSAKPEGEKTLRTLFAISLSPSPCITEAAVITAFHSRRTRSSVHETGFIHTYDGSHGLGAALSFGDKSSCAGMLYLSQITSA
jgi:hypothetical protein